jgi:hypothetical protein
LPLDAHDHRAYHHYARENASAIVQCRPIVIGRLVVLTVTPYGEESGASALGCWCLSQTLFTG